jgi:hypothetical protein
MNWGDFTEMTHVLQEHFEPLTDCPQGQRQRTFRRRAQINYRIAIVTK